jgi:hypothetical protein
MCQPVLTSSISATAGKSAKNKQTPHHQANAIQPHKKAFQMIQLTSSHQPHICKRSVTTTAYDESSG